MLSGRKLKRMGEAHQKNDRLCSRSVSSLNPMKPE